MAAPKQNFYATKNPADKADSHLHIRVKQTDLDHWKDAFPKSGARSFSDWVVDTLNKRSGNKSR